MRRYLETHPWIRFDASGINELRPRAWMLLGEARARCDHLAGMPLHPGIAEKLYEVALIKGVQASTAIEGNTLTTEQVTGILHGTYSAPPSRAYQEQEVRNVLDALRAIDFQVRSGEMPVITAESICEYNRQVLEGTDHEPDAVPGLIRDHQVGVWRYQGAPAEDGPYLIDRLADWLESDTFRAGDPEVQFARHIAAAICAHLYIAWIHPFGDGNGRTARLLEFAILARSGTIPLAAAHLLSDHYNLTRDRYSRELAASSKTQSITEFATYAVEGLVDGLREQIALVRGQQLYIAWVNYVNEVLGRFKSGPSRDRQNTLVLAMLSDEPLSREELTQLTPEVAVLYAHVGPRTLSRDLNRLQETGLIVLGPDGDGWQANVGVLEAFLPPTAVSNKS